MKVVKLLFDNDFEEVSYFSTTIQLSYKFTFSLYRTLISCYHNDSVVLKTMQTQTRFFN